MNWIDTLNKDASQLDLCINEYSDKLLELKGYVEIKGNVIDMAKKMPYMTDIAFSYLQEIEAVLELFNIKLKQERSKLHKKYLENYQRALGTRDIEKYIDGEPVIVNLSLDINRIALMRNKFASITKSLEIKHFQLSNIIKMKVAGLDDFDLN